MEDVKNTKIISDREQSEWIKGCPLQVKRTAVVKNSAGKPAAVVTSCPCTEEEIAGYSARIECLDAHKEHIGDIDAASLKAGVSEEIPLGFDNCVYAYTVITSVETKNGGIWKNESGTRGEKLKTGDPFWQTDPLYEQIRREFAGVTEPRYKPVNGDGFWVCTCGQVNLTSSGRCGSCHVSKEWLDEHLDEEYLRRRMEEDSKKSEKTIEREVRHKKEGLSDGEKAAVILAGVVLIIALAVLTVKVFVPASKYARAEKLLENGEYDEAIDEFTALGKFRDSVSLLEEANIGKAKEMTGLDKVNYTTSALEPCFKIDENGVLSFKQDDYKGSWDNFVVPDVVDGVVVRELERNFFLNCKELTAVTISDCVEVLGEQTFYNCEKLTTVNFGKNIREIGARAFINCYALEELEIPDTVEKLGLRAFNNCTSLKKVILGNHITSISSYTFSLCTSLEAVTLKSPITVIGEYAFSECAKLKNIFCRFAESEWTDPELSEGNEAWENVKLSFNN